MATMEELEGMSEEDLQKMAMDKGIDNAKEMDKEALVNALMKEEGGDMGEKSEMVSDDEDEDEDEDEGTTY